MDSKNLDLIVDNLFSLNYIFHRKFLKFDKHPSESGLSHVHFGVIGILSSHEALPVSEIGKKLGVSKPQMTSVIDKLIEKNLVERLPDKSDRRVINIQITERGREQIKEVHELMRATTKNKVLSLSDQDLDDLSDSLIKLKTILGKLE